MTDSLKCPYCNIPLVQDDNNLYCPNDHCNYWGSKELWQDFIRLFKQNEKKMKQKPLKFIVSSPYYESLFRREIDAIRDTIGEFEVVKTKPCLGGVDIKIWVLPI